MREVPPAFATKTRAAILYLWSALFLALGGTSAAAPFTFESTGPLGGARWAHTATLLGNGTVLVTGGVGIGIIEGRTEIYDPATGGWKLTDELTTPRSSHTATLLPTGKVLVTGGIGTGGTGLNSAELYDPLTQMWSATGDLSVARAYHTATLLPNGKVLVVGGKPGSTNLPGAELYDPASGTWSTTGNLIAGRGFHTAAVLPNGKVLVAGGRAAGSNRLASAELYDPASGLWSATGPLTAARQDHTATLLPNGKVLAIGGEGTSGVRLASAELYDPIAGTWSATSSLAAARSSHLASLLPNGKLLVAGGEGASAGRLASAEIYDPVAGTWGATGNLSTARSYPTATLLPGGRLLVAGGLGTGSSPLASAELFDATHGVWGSTRSLGTFRREHTATLLPNGKVLVAGGIGGSSGFTVLASAELYDPASYRWSPTTGNLTVPRAGHTATLLSNGKVLVVGGFGLSGGVVTPLHSAELYDPATDIWSPTGSLVLPGVAHTATLLTDGTVLLVGGLNDFAGSASLARTEIYDPASGTWSLTGRLNTARSSHTATLIAFGSVLAAGGRDGSNSLASAEIYDPSAKTWKPAKGNLVTARRDAVATLLPGGRVLVAGGSIPTEILKSAEIYDVDSGWLPTGSLAGAHSRGTATLLPGGTVLVAGGLGNAGNLADIYDPASGTWSSATNMGEPRSAHTATFLPNGTVLIAGRLPPGGSTPTFGCEIFDPGLVSPAAARPVISTAAFASPGGALMLTGSGFRGISGASGGTTQDSPTNYPLVQLRSMVSERTAFFRTTPEPAGSATGLTVPSPGFIVGPALVTVFVNGIPSEAAIVHVENRPAVLPPVVLSIVHETGGTRVRWQDFSGGLFSIQYSDTLSSWRLFPGEFRATNSVIEFFDFTQPIPPRRFYRPVRVAP